MKYLILLALLLVPCIARAQGFTPVPKDVANKYFTNCAAQPSQGMSQQSQQTLCACTAARMTQFFSMDDMQKMMSQDPSVARPAYNKMLVDVYAPCMDTPSYDYYYQTCISNPDTARYGDPQRVCQCLAGKVAAHLKNNGPQVFAQLLQRNPNLTDPMSALTSDSSFKAFAQDRLLSCVTK